jgi:transposase
LGDPPAQSAFEHMLGHLATLDAQLAAVDGQLERVASSEPWAERVAWLCSFRAIATRTALGLLAEIGDFRRFATPRELMSYLGLTPTEYSSGVQQHRGQITKAGNTHARRLLIEAAWHYQHRPRQSARAGRLAADVPPEITARAWQAQTRLFLRHRALVANGKRSTVATTAVARELVGFIWAAMVAVELRTPPPEVAAA